MKTSMRASERSEQQKASKSQLVLCCWLASLANLDADEHASQQAKRAASEASSKKRASRN